MAPDAPAWQTLAGPLRAVLERLGAGDAAGLAALGSPRFATRLASPALEGLLVAGLAHGLAPATIDELALFDVEGEEGSWLRCPEGPLAAVQAWAEPGVLALGEGRSRTGERVRFSAAFDPTGRLELLHLLPAGRQDWTARSWFELGRAPRSSALLARLAFLQARLLSDAGPVATTRLRESIDAALAALPAPEEPASWRLPDGSTVRVQALRVRPPDAVELVFIGATEDASALAREADALAATLYLRHPELVSHFGWLLLTPIAQAPGPGSPITAAPRTARRLGPGGPSAP